MRHWKTVSNQVSKKGSQGFLIKEFESSAPSLVPDGSQVLTIDCQFGS